MAVPESALIQEGTRAIVFVASGESPRMVTRRNVALVGRGPDVVYIHAQPTAEEQQAGCRALSPGEWVVASGTIELNGALADALATRPAREELQH